MSSINWYPGHMKKTRDLITSHLNTVDIVIEILDARIPISSKNPEIDSIVKNKYRILLLNKMDLVPDKDLKIYSDYFKNNNFANEVIAISVEKGTNMNLLKSHIDKLYKEKLEKVKKKGLIKTQIRAMVLGIPNVGKSKFINKISNKSKAKVGNLPGFTRGKQWIKVNDYFNLLDTPGILWPKFEDQNVAMSLAITGSIKDQVLKTEEVCNELFNRLKKYDNIDDLKKAYKLDLEESLFDIDNYKIMDIIAKRLGIVKHSEYDYTQISEKILKDYRNGKLGKYILELPNESE